MPTCSRKVSALQQIITFMSVATQTKHGILFALGAYTLWGLAPIYFKQLSMISAFEILAHRIVWSVVALSLFIWLLRQKSQLIDALKKPKRMLILLIASLLLAVNWLLYVWAVNHDRILEASLGYYINPLINVLLGRIILAEKLRRLQYFAVALVCVGVAILLIGFGEFPVIAICLAVSFSVYGLLRKMVSVGPLPGLTIETVIMLPIALVYMAFFASEYSNLTSNTLSLNILLVSAGLLSTVPLLFFTAAAKRLQYSTLGFLQYLGPTIMFFVAVIVYDEPFTLERVVIFSFVWGGVILFCADSLRTYRKQRIQPSAS